MTVVALFAAILVAAIAIIIAAIAPVTVVMAAIPMGAGNDLEVWPFCVENRFGEVLRSAFV